MNIDTISGKQQPLRAYLHCSDPSQHGIDVSKPVLSVEKQPINHIIEEFEITPIDLSGDYKLKIDLRYKERDYAKSLVAFKAIAQETMLGWVIGTIIGICLLVAAIWNIILLTTQ